MTYKMALFCRCCSWQIQRIKCWRKLNWYRG